MRLKLLLSLIVIIGFAGTVFAWKPWEKKVETKAPDNVADFVNQMLSDETRTRPPAPEGAGGRAATDAPSPSPARGEGKTPTPPPTPPAAIIFECTAEKESDFGCYDKYYSSLVAGDSIMAAVDDLRGRYDASAYVRSQCHPLTHIIGRAGAKKYPTVAEAYTHGDSFCWSGYYHGVMEGIIDKIGYANLVKEIDSICKPLADAKRYQFDHYNCVHGLGHGVMALTNDELFDSLEICDAVQDSWERQSCWSGAYMENVIVDGLNHFTKYLKPSDPLFPCNASKDQYKSTCYLMQTSYMLKVLNGDYSRVFAECAKVEEQHRDTCYQSLGRDVSGRSTSNVSATIAGCQLGTDLEQRKNCAIGAVKDFISYLHDDKRARELCASFSEKEIQDTCLETAEGYYQLF